METQSIRPETIVAGFSHFLWLFLLATLIIGIDPTGLFTSLANISVGATALLGSAIFGASYFLGALANRILGDLSNLVGNPPTASELMRARQKNKDAASAVDSSWACKSLFRSVAISGLISLPIAFCLISKFGHGKELLVISFIGIPLEIAAIIAFFTQRHQYLADLKALIDETRQ